MQPLASPVILLNKCSQARITALNCDAKQQQQTIDSGIEKSIEMESQGPADGDTGGDTGDNEMAGAEMRRDTRPRDSGEDVSEETAEAAKNIPM